MSEQFCKQQKGPGVPRPWREANRVSKYAKFKEVFVC